MRDNVKKIVKITEDIVDFKEPIIELGSYQVQGQEGFADLRPFFPGKKYIGCDFRLGPGVDQIENPEIGFSFKDNTIGTVISCDTLEHVFDIFKTVHEIERILVPGGTVLIISVMFWPIHGYPHDYWRFTPECFRRLLEIFPQPWTMSLGDERFPHTVVGVAKKNEPLSETVRKKLEHEIKSLPPHFGSAWKSPREKLLEAEIAELKRLFSSK